MVGNSLYYNFVSSPDTVASYYLEIQGKFLSSRIWSAIRFIALLFPVQILYYYLEVHGLMFLLLISVNALSMIALFIYIEFS